MNKTDCGLKDYLYNTIRIKSFDVQGNEFSFEFEYNVVKKEWKKTIFGGWSDFTLSNIGKSNTCAMSYEDFAASLPEGVSATTEHRILDDGRKYNSSYATITEGDVATIHVPQSISWSIFYEHYGKEGYAFRDYLLDNRRDIIAQLIAALKTTKHHGIRKPCWNKLPSLFTVEPYSVYRGTDPNDMYDENQAILFSEFGMGTLDTFTQRYGLSLAIVELCKSDFISTSHPTINLRYKTNYAGTVINVYITPRKDNMKTLETQTLQKW